METLKPHTHYFNTEPKSLNPKFDKVTIDFAITYANDAITLEPREVGKTIYDKLHAEKIFEYLNSINY